MECFERPLRDADKLNQETRIEGVVDSKCLEAMTNGVGKKRDGAQGGQAKIAGPSVAQACRQILPDAIDTQKSTSRSTRRPFSPITASSSQLDIGVVASRRTLNAWISAHAASAC